MLWYWGLTSQPGPIESWWSLFWTTCTAAEWDTYSRLAWKNIQRTHRVLTTTAISQQRSWDHHKTVKTITTWDHISISRSIQSKFNLISSGSYLDRLVAQWVVSHQAQSSPATWSWGSPQSWGLSGLSNHKSRDLTQQHMIHHEAGY